METPVTEQTKNEYQNIELFNTCCNQGKSLTLPFKNIDFYLFLIFIDLLETFLKKWMFLMSRDP